MNRPEWLGVFCFCCFAVVLIFFFLALKHNVNYKPTFYFSDPRESSLQGRRRDRKVLASGLW